MFLRIGAVQNSSKFTAEHLCWSLFLIKLKENPGIQHRVLPVNSAKLFKNSFLQNTSRTKFSKESFIWSVWKVSVFGVFLVRIFPHSDWIRIDNPYLSVFSPNAEKYGPEKLRTRTLFTVLKWIIVFMISFIIPQLSNNCSKSAVKIRRWRNFRYLSCWLKASTGLCYSYIYKICLWS